MVWYVSINRFFQVGGRRQDNDRNTLFQFLCCVREASDALCTKDLFQGGLVRVTAGTWPAPDRPRPEVE